ncbi:hypothetical protein ABZX12_26370 [Kribbella sp. NPDC003505]|uniref:hypothetical protein n=1 Tax=Kribbella sp. NPDC003505 TaxID=3154448 RepID=UPI0033ABB537
MVYGRSTVLKSALDRHMPRYDFAEAHERWIDAEQAEVWRALLDVRLADLRIARTLVTLRGLAPTANRAGQPLATHGPVKMLTLDENRCAIAGAISQPWRLAPPRHKISDLSEFVAFEQPGWAKYLTSFELAPRDAGTILRTVTRVSCTDLKALRNFRLYWLVLRPGSGLVRRDLLSTVARLAG